MVLILPLFLGKVIHSYDNDENDVTQLISPEPSSSKRGRPVKKNA